MKHLVESGDLQDPTHVVLLAEGAKNVSVRPQGLVSRHERREPGGIEKRDAREIDGDIAIGLVEEAGCELRSGREIDFAGNRDHDLSTIVDRGRDRETLRHDPRPVGFLATRTVPNSTARFRNPRFSGTLTVGGSHLAGVDGSTMASVETQFPATAEAPQSARAFLRAALETWKLDGFGEVTELLTDELVANVVRHVGSPMTLRATSEGATLRIEVDDPSTEAPVLHHPDVRDGSGRGILLVDAPLDAVGSRDPRRRQDRLVRNRRQHRHAARCTDPTSASVGPATRV